MLVCLGSMDCSLSNGQHPKALQIDNDELDIVSGSFTSKEYNN